MSMSLEMHTWYMRNIHTGANWMESNDIGERTAIYFHDSFIFVFVSFSFFLYLLWNKEGSVYLVCIVHTRIFSIARDISCESHEWMSHDLSYSLRRTQIDNENENTNGISMSWFW